MTPEILAYLKNEPSDYVPSRLAIFCRHWRDRLQTEEARAALIDDLALEVQSDGLRVGVELAAWAETAEAAWLAYAEVADQVELAAAVQAALAADTLTGWAGAHDSLGACGLASVDATLETATCVCCYSAARLAPYAEVAGPLGPDGEPTTVREYKAHEPVVAGLQASLRAVLVGLCAGG